MAKQSEYTIVRDSIHLERMWWLYQRLGIQSNVVVAARYASSDDGRLSKTIVLEALGKVVEAHPQLRAVGVVVPAAKKGNLGLSIAMLHNIDLEACVEFVDQESNPGITAEMLEHCHNEWDFNEPDRPWFKLYVVGRDTIIFVYSHVLADGKSGSTFHRSFLEALNSKHSSTKANGSSPGSSSWVISADPSTTRLPASLIDIGEQGRDLGRPWQANTLLTLWRVLCYWICQIFFARWFMFHELPEAKPHLASTTAVATESERTVSKTIIGRISATTMSKVMAACRANGVTFTPFLYTMFNITFANDFYPKATFGAGRCPVEFRGRLPSPLKEQELGVIGNRVGGTDVIERMQKYRNVIVDSAEPRIPGQKAGKRLNKGRVWELARATKSWIDGGIDSCVSVLLTHKPAGADLDYFVENALPMVGVSLRPTFSVSNIGSYAPTIKGQLEEGGQDHSSWRLTDMVFSAAVTNGRQGSRAPIFSVAGVKGEDTTIVAGWEDGVANQEMVQGVLDATLARIEALVA